MEEMYCIVCHGRGLDNHDHVCQHCEGTGIEPEFPRDLIEDTEE